MNTTAEPHGAPGEPVVVAGHVCVDLLPSFNGRPAIIPGALLEVGPMAIRSGGCVANTGLDLAALGTPVRLFADTGDDEMADLLGSLLAQDRVDATGVRRRAGAATSFSVVVEAPSFDRSFWHHVGANAAFDGRDVDVAGASIVHVGYPTVLPALVERGGAALVELLGRARDAEATTSIDLATMDPASPLAEMDWRELLAAVLPLVDVFAPSVDDLRSVLPDALLASIDELRVTAAWLIESGAAVVVLKAGAAGLYLRTAGRDRLIGAGSVLAGDVVSWADRELWVTAPRVPVASTTGAGDAAVAGLLHGIAARLGPLGAGCAARDAAAARVQRPGALPRWADVHHVAGEGCPDLLAAGRWAPGAPGTFAGPAERERPKETKEMEPC